MSVVTTPPEVLIIATLRPFVVGDTLSTRYIGVHLVSAVGVIA